MYRDSKMFVCIHFYEFEKMVKFEGILIYVSSFIPLSLCNLNPVYTFLLLSLFKSYQQSNSKSGCNAG